jgi:hypothetical protein
MADGSLSCRTASIPTVLPGNVPPWLALDCSVALPTQGLARPRFFFVSQLAGAPDIGFPVGFKTRVRVTGIVPHCPSIPTAWPAHQCHRSRSDRTLRQPIAHSERNTLRSRLIILTVEALLKFLPSPGQPRTVRYGITVVLVAIFFLFSLAAGIAVGPFEFLFLILPVLLASVLYDRGSGFLATGLSVLVMASQPDWRTDPVGNLAALVTSAIVASFVAVFFVKPCEKLWSGGRPHRKS